MIVWGTSLNASRRSPSKGEKVAQLFKQPSTATSQLGQADWALVDAKGRADWTVLEGSCHPELHVDREEGSGIIWANLWPRQWPESGSTRTLLSSISCQIGRLRGLLDGLHDLSNDFHKSEATNTKAKIVDALLTARAVML